MLLFEQERKGGLAKIHEELTGIEARRSQEYVITKRKEQSKNYQDDTQEKTLSDVRMYGIHGWPPNPTDSTSSRVGGAFSDSILGNREPVGTRTNS